MSDFSDVQVDNPESYQSQQQDEDTYIPDPRVPLEKAVDAITNGVISEYIEDDNYEMGLLSDLDYVVKLSDQEIESRKELYNPIVYWTAKLYCLLPGSPFADKLRWVAFLVLTTHAVLRAHVYLTDPIPARGVASFVIFLFNDFCTFLIGVLVARFYFNQPMYDRLVRECNQLPNGSRIESIRMGLMVLFVFLWIFGSVLDIVEPDTPILFPIFEFPLVVYANGANLFIYFVFCSVLIMVIALVRQATQHFAGGASDRAALDSFFTKMTKPVTASFLIELTFPRPWFTVIPVVILQFAAFLYNFGNAVGTAEGVSMDARDINTGTVDLIFNITILLLCIVPWIILKKETKKLRDLE